MKLGIFSGRLEMSYEYITASSQEGSVYSRAQDICRTIYGRPDENWRQALKHTIKIVSEGTELHEVLRRDPRAGEMSLVSSRALRRDIMPK
jgi:hypothetical protein